MSDYIKREDAIKAFEPSQRRDWYTPWIVETLEDLPSADVAAVRHGWWDTSEDNRIVCSECTNGAPYMYKINDKLIMQELTYYCPYCGAIMDGGDD